jgi:hypothetical protein
MMPHRLSFACLAVWLLVPSGPAAAAEASACGRFDAPEVRIDFESVPVHQDFTRSMAQLQSMPGRAPAPREAANGRVLGLAHAKYGERSQVGVVFRATQDGGYCGTLGSLTVNFGFEERTVLVARELPTNVCIHGEVLKHEMRHVAVDEKALKDFIPTVRRTLETLAAHVGVVRGRTREQLTGAIRRPIEAALRDMLREFGQERERRQAEVDTLEEYKRVSASCGGELSRYVGTAASGHF